MNLTIAEASMARPGSTGDHTVFDELARLADTLDDERIVFEVEIRIVMEWVVCAGDLLRGMCEAPSHTFNPVNGSEYETEPSCRMRDTKNKRSLCSLERWNFRKERLRDRGRPGPRAGNEACCKSSRWGNEAVADDLDIRSTRIV